MPSKRSKKVRYRRPKPKSAGRICSRAAMAASVNDQVAMNSEVSLKDVSFIMDVSFIKDASFLLGARGAVVVLAWVLDSAIPTSAGVG